MIICPKCGVELDERMSRCPLCNSGVGHQFQPDPNSKAYDDQRDEKLLSDFVNLTGSQKRKLFWELAGIILFSGILVTLIIDIVTAGNITWSRYTFTVCLVIFVNITLLSFWRQRLVILLGGSFISTSLLLVLLDLYNEKVGWGTQLGVPLLLALYIILFLLVILVRFTKHKGFNVIGYSFIAAGILSLCIEGMLDLYFNGKITFRWSLIAFVSMIPIAAMLFFIHYRLNRGIELRRFFHI